jgi:hypothetical protein
MAIWGTVQTDGPDGGGQAQGKGGVKDAPPASGLGDQMEGHSISRAGTLGGQTGVGRGWRDVWVEMPEGLESHRSLDWGPRGGQNELIGQMEGLRRVKEATPAYDGVSRPCTACTVARRYTKSSSLVIFKWGTVSPPFYRWGN